MKWRFQEHHGFKRSIKCNSVAAKHWSYWSGSPRLSVLQSIGFAALLGVPLLWTISMRQGALTMQWWVDMDRIPPWALAILGSLGIPGDTWDTLESLHIWRSCLTAFWNTTFWHIVSDIWKYFFFVAFHCDISFWHSFWHVYSDILPDIIWHLFWHSFSRAFGDRNSFSMLQFF